MSNEHFDDANRYEQIYRDKSRAAGTYVQSEVSLTPTIEMLLQEITVPSKVLEIGFGGGHLAYRLSQMGHEIRAIDLSCNAVEVARNRYPGIDFIQMDAAQLDFSPESFNTVVALETIEHIPDSESHFEQVARILVPGGTFIIKTPNAWLDRLYYRYILKVDASLEHCSLCNTVKLKTLLNETGFECTFFNQGGLSGSQFAKAENLFNWKGPAYLIDRLIRFFPHMVLPSITCRATLRGPGIRR